MKNSSLFMVLVAAVFTLLPALPSLAASDFCWRDSEVRGVGMIPSACPEGRERIGLLCYSKCGANMKRVGFDCHSACPEGMRDDGLFCRRAEYGRGAGYPWKFGDPAFNLDPARDRCEGAHGRGNCEKWGAIYYPKCSAGYHTVGCCVCRPDTPDCGKLGLNAGIDLSCAKRIKVGDPVPGVCGSGLQTDAGLCYSACKPGLDGVGPVCWSRAPKGWVMCGMGAAKDGETCSNIVFGQVSSVGKLALEVAAAVTEVAEAKGSERAGLLREKFGSLVKAFDQIRNIPEVKTAIGAHKSSGPTLLVSAESDNTAKLLEKSKSAAPEDIEEAAEEIAEVVETSGVEDTIGAYRYPKCSALAKKATK
jgi:hypothetical protein